MGAWHGSISGRRSQHDSAESVQGTTAALLLRIFRAIHWPDKLNIRHWLLCLQVLGAPKREDVPYLGSLYAQLMSALPLPTPLHDSLSSQSHPHSDGGLTSQPLNSTSTLRSWLDTVALSPRLTDLIFACLQYSAAARPTPVDLLRAFVFQATSSAIHGSDSDGSSHTRLCPDEFVTMASLSADGPFAEWLPSERVSHAFASSSIMSSPGPDSATDSDSTWRTEASAQLAVSLAIPSGQATSSAKLAASGPPAHEIASSSRPSHSSIIPPFQFDGSDTTDNVPTAATRGSEKEASFPSPPASIASMLASHKTFAPSVATSHNADSHLSSNKSESSLSSAFHDDALFPAPPPFTAAMSGGPHFDPQLQHFYQQQYLLHRQPPTGMATTTSNASASTCEPTQPFSSLFSSAPATLSSSSPTLPASLIAALNAMDEPSPAIATARVDPSALYPHLFDPRSAKVSSSSSSSSLSSAAGLSAVGLTDTLRLASHTADAVAASNDPYVTVDDRMSALRRSHVEGSVHAAAAGSQKQTQQQPQSRASTSTAPKRLTAAQTARLGTSKSRSRDAAKNTSAPGAKPTAANARVFDARVTEPLPVVIDQHEAIQAQLFAETASMTLSAIPVWEVPAATLSASEKLSEAVDASEATARNTPLRLDSESHVSPASHVSVTDILRPHPIHRGHRSVYDGGCGAESVGACTGWGSCAVVAPLVDTTASSNIASSANKDTVATGNDSSRAAVRTEPSRHASSPALSAVSKSLKSSPYQSARPATTTGTIHTTRASVKPPSSLRSSSMGRGRGGRPMSALARLLTREAAQPVAVRFDLAEAASLASAPSSRLKAPASDPAASESECVASESVVAAAIPPSTASFGGIPADLFYTRRAVVRPTLLGAIRAHGMQRQTAAAATAAQPALSEVMWSPPDAAVSTAASASSVKAGVGSARVTNKLPSVCLQCFFAFIAAIDNSLILCLL